MQCTQKKKFDLNQTNCDLHIVVTERLQYSSNGRYLNIMRISLRREDPFIYISKYHVKIDVYLILIILFVETVSFRKPVAN